MVYGVFQTLIGALSLCVISSGALLQAECSIDTISSRDSPDTVGQGSKPRHFLLQALC